MPFLHLEAQRDDPQRRGWPHWVERFGYHREGAARGVHYRHARLALEAVRQNVGFLICGLSLVEDDLEQGRIVLPYPAHQSLVAPKPYVLTLTAHGTLRPQLQRFVDWLRVGARLTRQSLLRATAQVGSPGQKSSANEPE